MALPPSPPLLSADAMRQAQAAAKHLLTHQPAIEAAMRNRAAIEESIKLFEGDGVTRAAVEDAIAQQKAFEAVKPDLDAFNRCMASMGATPPYSPLTPHLLLQSQLDAADVQRALALYRDFLPPSPDIIALTQSALTPLENVVISSVGQAYISQISPWIGTLITEEPRQSFKDFFEDCQRICCHVLVNAHWCPTLLMSLPFKELVPLCELIERDRPADKLETALDSFVFQHLGGRYIDGVLEDWRELSLPSHILRLLKEVLCAYRRKEHGIVVSVLPTLWEGFIREKAVLIERPDSKMLRSAVAKLVEQNQYSDTVSAFYDTCIMYPCNGPEEAKSDVPGRHAAAHGWFVRYPTKKAALNAILFTDFLLRLEQLDTDAPE